MVIGDVLENLWICWEDGAFRLHHKLRELYWIACEGIEFEVHFGGGDVGPEALVSREANSVSVELQPLSEEYEWLNISSKLPQR